MRCLPPSLFLGFCLSALKLHPLSTIEMEEAGEEEGGEDKIGRNQEGAEGEKGRSDQEDDGLSGYDEDNLNRVCCVLGLALYFVFNIIYQ